MQDFEFGHHMGHRSVFKTTMVKGGGINVRWTQPVLLAGTGGTNLRVSTFSYRSIPPPCLVPAPTEITILSSI